MTVSGTTILNPTTNKLINRSLRMVGAYAASSTPRPEQVNDALDVLNMMLKSWQTDGHLWLKTFCTLFLNKGQSVYSLTDASNSGFSHCVTGYVQTTLATTASAGTGSVTLASGTYINDGHYLGIANNNGIIEWFFVNMTGAVAALFSNSALTVPATLGTDAASGNVCYAHDPAAQIDRPTRVFLASRKLYSATGDDGVEIPMTLFSREEYQSLPNKTVQAMPVQAYYDPQHTAGKLYIWPTSDNAREKIVLTVDRPINIMVSDLDTYDLPAEWLECITYGLAERLWPEYPTSGADYQMIAGRYSSLKEAIQSYDREPTSSFISMSRY